MAASRPCSVATTPTDTGSAAGGVRATALGSAAPLAAVAIRAPVATRPSGSTLEIDDTLTLPTSRLVPEERNQPAGCLAAAEIESGVRSWVCTGAGCRPRGRYC